MKICPKPNLSIFCRLVGILLISLLRSQIQAAITSTINSLLSSALGRSLPANKAAKVALRQGLFGDLGNLGNGGLLGGLTNNAAEQPANIMEDMAMNVSVTILLINFCSIFGLR